MKTAETYEYEEHTRRKEGGNHVVLCVESFAKETEEYLLEPESPLNDGPCKQQN